VDNGQHLFLGCYADTRRFLRRLRVEDRLTFLPSLRVPFLSPGGRRSELNCPALPGGLGFLAGLCRFDELRLADRWALLRAMAAFRLGRRKDLAGLTVSDWLGSLRQTPGALRAFWTPLCLATLNERPERASAAALAAVLREGFLRDAASAAPGYATLSLGRLWSMELVSYLKREGGVVAAGQKAAGFVIEGRRVRAVRVESGETVEADAVVCAVPLPAFLDLCPAPLAGRYADLRKTAYSSIVSVNFWFREPVFDEPWVGLLDTEVQWAFNRHRLWQGRVASPGAVTLVISAAASLARKSSDEIAALALADLRRCLPSIGQQSPHSTVVWERQATPSPTPEFWRRRPPAETALQNLFLAGDWVDSGLPPTIEAACRSGHRAARLAGAALGVSATAPVPAEA
jgi:squalene-associated FAD-dependent desaturase